MADETSAHDQILARLDEISKRLEAVESRVAGDAAVATGSPVQQKLADPDIAAGLARILDRMDTLEAATRTLESVGQRAPVLIDGAAETFDHFMMQAEARGIDVFERGFKGAEVLEKASRPENLELVDDLLDHAETVRFAAEAGTRAVGAIEDKDAFADGLGRLAGKGGAVLTSPALDKLLDSGLLDPTKLEASIDALQKLVDVATTPEFQKLLDSGVLDPAVLGTAGSASTALVEARKGGFGPVGLFGTLGKLGDPDVKKAMGFTFEVLKRFGQKL